MIDVEEMAVADQKEAKVFVAVGEILLGEDPVQVRQVRVGFGGLAVFDVPVAAEQKEFGEGTVCLRLGPGGVHFRDPPPAHFRDAEVHP